MIKQIELEITTSCNASCPQCSRNFYGGPRWPTVPDVSLNLIWLQEKLSSSVLENLELIRFCGTYGDPCVHPEFLDIVAWVKTVSPAKIVISTNGGMRNAQWWKNLALLLDKDDRVIFGIDGLVDTNHLYRRGVDFNKVINHAQTFNRHGGKSVWQFLVFKHNEHQIKQAQQLSAEIGFQDFIVKHTTRFVDKKHDLLQHVPVLDNKKIYFLKLPSDQSLINPGYESYEDNRKNHDQVEIQCIAKRLDMVYIGADGYVFPCGFLADRLYGFEAESHPDYEKMQNLFKEAGGAHLANLNYTDLDSIVNGAWFNTIEQSWNNGMRLERCAHQCGKGNQLVTSVYSYMRGEQV